MNKHFIKSVIALAGVVAMLMVSQLSFAGGHHHGEVEHQEEEKGPNNGRLLHDGDFALELQLFENGLPPEFRIYVTDSGQPVAPEDVSVSMQLTRLGDVVDRIAFTPEETFLRGDTVIYEPHSFVVKIEAKYQGKSHIWHYDNFEGRTKIPDAMADEMAITTGVVGEKTLEATTKVYGSLVLPINATRHISARYPGKVTELNVVRGQRVKKGQLLMRIQSNDSLQSYSVFAPISGVIAEQNTAVGEQADTEILLSLVDMSELYAELKVFPNLQPQINVGTDVYLSLANGKLTVRGQVWDRLTTMDQQQAMTYRVKVDNRELNLLPGQFVQADVVTERFVAPLAVPVNALQAFRDFTVVYTKVGEEYEVRMLELGRRAGDWVEVLSGIQAGAQYVNQNSYIIKADIEKSGASHDH